MDIASWVYIAAAALSPITLGVSLTTVTSLKYQIQKQLATQGQQLSDSIVSAAVTASFTVSVSVIFGVLHLAAYILFAVFRRLQRTGHASCYS